LHSSKVYYPCGHILFRLLPLHQNHQAIFVIMDTGFRHSHVLVVILFLLWFGFKWILLLINSPLLDKVRDKFKMVDMILGTLILVTGGYLLFKGGHPETWMMVKVALVLAFIPLGIIGLRRENKVLTSIVFVGFLYIYGVAETRSLVMKKPKGIDTVGVYEINCARCHGTDGAAMLYGAKNLKISTLSKEEAAYIIKNGKGAMPAITSNYTDKEIDQLAEYVITLRKK